MPKDGDGDGRTHVSLSELIALRSRVMRPRLSKLPSRAMRSGQQSSRLYGRGMDYAESRVYQAGDDVRRLDWRLTARSGKLHTKLFQEDHEGCLLILQDTNASMRFGTRVRFKSVQAARAAAYAGWYAIRAGERAGVMAYGQSDRLLRPRAGSHGALALCGTLAEMDLAGAASHAETLADAVNRAGHLLHGANRVLVISDGYSCDAEARKRLLELSRHAGVSILIVADALELNLAPPGRYPVEQGGVRRELALHSERQRQDFQRVLGAGAQRLAELAQSLGMRHATIDTAADPFDAVTGLLDGRRQGR